MKSASIFLHELKSEASSDVCSFHASDTLFSPIIKNLLIFLLTKLGKAQTDVLKSLSLFSFSPTSSFVLEIYNLCTISSAMEPIMRISW